MKSRNFGVCLVTSLAAAMFSGCAHAGAKGVVDSPRLAIPAPPPRVVETAEAEPPTPTPVPLVEEPAHQSVRPPGRPASRPETARTEPSKAEPPKVEAPVDLPKVADDPPKAPTTLQTTPAVAEAEVERAIRTAMTRANADLGRVDYRALSKDGQTQYNTAKRFIEQAEEAMDPRTRNLLFAKNLADKAVALAAQLAAR